MKLIFLAFRMAVLCSLLTSCNFEPHFSTLSDWEKHTARSGFRLLDATQTADYLITVYETGHDEIAFCYHSRGSGPDPASETFEIYGDPQMDLHDTKRPHSTDLSWRRTVWFPPPFSPVTHGGTDGIIYPIVRGYRGELRITFSVDDGLGGGDRIMYNKKIKL